MSDSIINCTEYKDINGNIIYIVNFSFDINVPEGWDNIYIMGNELSDLTDLVAVKTLACRKASAIKNMCSTATVITNLDGPVTL
jgi:hypothetical protein